MRNVKDFGAVGDGITKDTVAIQKAIDAGGMVFLPAGIYLCGTLYLKSNGGLHLEAGATILGSPDPSDYNADDFCAQNAAFSSESVSGAHLIVAVEQQGIAITGAGRINGNRQAFYPDYQKHDKIYSTPIKWRPGQMIYFCECTNVTIDGVELYHAPYWTCFLHGCENVTIHGVKIYNWQYTRNGDGIDIDCCRFVTVSDCIIDSGDDCITLRGNDVPLKSKRACEFITVTNCVLQSRCNAFRIGVGNGTVRAAVISNIVIHNSRNGITLCSKYSSDKGVKIEDIQFQNIYSEGLSPLRIFINTGHASGAAIQPIQRISFDNFRARSKYGAAIAGEAPGDISELKFTNCEFTVEQTSEAAEPLTESNAGVAGFYCQNVSDLTLVQVKVNMSDPEQTGVAAIRVNDLKIKDCQLGKMEIN